MNCSFMNACKRIRKKKVFLLPPLYEVKFMCNHFVRGNILYLNTAIGSASSTCLQVAKENADVIIMDDNFTSIVNVARWGRSVYINIQKFVQFQLTVNIVALMLNFISACVSGLFIHGIINLSCYVKLKLLQKSFGL